MPTQSNGARPDVKSPESRRKNARSFLLLLGLSVFLGTFAFFFPPAFLNDSAVPPPDEEISQIGEADPASAEESAPADIVITPEGSAPETSEPEASEAETDVPLPFTEVDVGYFDDALFIGDSRTEGIREYSDLQNAAFFADRGLSVFKVFTVELTLKDIGKTTLEELLRNRAYGKIYFMMGVNELGYPYESLIKKYTQTVETIRSLQPDAILYLCANLHVTKSKSDAEPDVNNANIDRLNAEIAGMTDGRTSFYIDANERFDDAEGNLDTRYSADNAHVFAKYYRVWGAFLLTKAVVP